MKNEKLCAAILKKGYRIAQTSPDLAPVANFMLRRHEKWMAPVALSV
jgi:hypothetical protein